MNKFSILAVDPAAGLLKSASKIGWSIFQNGQLADYDVLFAEAVLNPTVRHALLDRCNLLVIEDQYIGINPKSAKMLIEAKCRWTIPAKDRSIPVREVMPSEWQSKICPGWQLGMQRKELAKQARFYVALRFQLPNDAGADAISAIGLGAYAVDRIKMGGWK